MFAFPYPVWLLLLQLSCCSCCFTVNVNVVTRTKSPTTASPTPPASSTTPGPSTSTQSSTRRCFLSSDDFKRGQELNNTLSEEDERELMNEALSMTGSYVSEGDDLNVGKSKAYEFDSYLNSLL